MNPFTRLTARFIFLGALFLLPGFCLTAANRLLLGSASGIPGSGIWLPIEIQHDGSAVAIHLDLQLDSSLFLLESDQVLSKLTNHHFRLAWLDPATLRLIIVPDTPHPLPLPQGEMLYLPFTIHQQAAPATYLLRPSAILIADADALPVPPEGLIPGSISVRASNQPPTASQTELAVLEDQVAVGFLNAEDPDSDRLSFQVVQQPQKGRVHLADSFSNRFVYLPGPNLEGSDAFSFQAFDGSGFSNLADVRIQIQGRNDSPSSTLAQVQLLEDQVAAFTPQVTDPDADEQFHFSILSSPLHGTASSLNSSLRYTPSANYFGYDEFSYLVSDRSGSEIEGFARLEISEINDPPELSLPSLQVQEDSLLEFTPSVSDPDPNERHSLLLPTPPQHGTLLIQGAALSYRPNPDFSGTDSFVLRVLDRAFLFEDLSASIQVMPQNDPPTSVQGSLETCFNQPSQPSIPEIQDPDLAYEGDQFSLQILTQPEHGTATVESEGLVYSPSSSAESDTFRVQVTDRAGASVSGMIAVTIDRFHEILLQRGYAVGLLDLDLSATSNCGDSGLAFEWRDSQTQALLGNQPRLILAPPSATTTLDVSATDPLQPLTLTTSLRLLVNPAGTDLNGDGFNNLQDLQLNLPFWGGALRPFDADGDGLFNLKDLIYIHTGN